MDEKMRFIGRLLEGDTMTSVCDEFGVSRKTGYKIWNRYQNVGSYALLDRSRKPHRFGNQLPEQIQRTILRLKKEKPHFGARKIRDSLIRKFPHLPVPAISTVHAVFDRHGLVNCRGTQAPQGRGNLFEPKSEPQ
jgi:transposase-like protein